VLLDVRILIETIGIILFGKGATEVRPRRTAARAEAPWPAASPTRAEAMYVSYLAGSAPAPRTARQP
jgi:hypothetical protein